MFSSKMCFQYYFFFAFVPIIGYLKQKKKKKEQDENETKISKSGTIFVARTKIAVAHRCNSSSQHRSNQIYE